MAKIDDLRGKYKNINEGTLVFFNAKDPTPTKKYLEYMLKIWDKRAEYHVGTRTNIVESVKLFDELLPYMTDKDIYSNNYKSILQLNIAIEKAQELKDEKYFKKEDHIIVINETDTYLLLFPKTHKGSLKYGASTRWCTASKGNEQTFNTYKRGCLAYLIDKRGGKTTNFSKLAFYSEYTLSINEGYQIFMANDNTTTGNSLIGCGWTEDEVFEIDVYYRNFVKKMKNIKSAKDDVNRVISFMKQIDIEKFKTNLNILNISNDDISVELDKTIKNFNEKFSKVNLLNI